ncbi:tetratricopeptide repeat protein [Actinoplanes sp. NPDC049316]|uniref:tetratricopeptide repeat protein n=1 Tax=Actinoplanes sp. NPDC049316 TaxID=3154727 RepID=UPI00343B67BF
MSPGTQQPADPRAALTAALRRLRHRLPDLSDETLARRAGAAPLPSGRRVAVNPRRLGEWLRGSAVPRDFDQLLAVVRAMEAATGGSAAGGEPASPAEAWRRLWRAAREHRAPVQDASGPAASATPVPATGCLVVGRPPSDATALCERPELRAAVDDALRDDTVHQVLLTGPGGVGKTQLAAAAFHRARAGGGLLAWVTATTRQSVLSTYARMWRALAAGTPDGGTLGHDEETQADLLLAWLRAPDRPWLVVLDDVDDPAELDSLWPVAAHGRVIVTTRRRDALMMRPAVRVVPVGMFHPEESVAYLLGRLSLDPAGGRPEPADLAGLANSLGHFPLALSQAAAFLIDTGVTVASYHRMVEDSGEQLADLFPPSSPADGHAGTVATTWRLAADRAALLAPAGSVARMLDLVSVLAPAGTPEQVLLGPAAREWVGGGERSALLALRALHRLSLVDHHRGVVVMHALVQRAVRESAPPEAGARLALAAANALEEAWAAHGGESGFDAAAYDGVSALRRVAGEHLWAGGMHPVLRRIPEHLAAAGRTAAARSAAEELLREARTRHGERHRDVVFLQTQVAWAISDLGDPAGALEILTPLCRRAEELLGADDPDTLAARLYEARQLYEVGAAQDAFHRLQSLADAAGTALGPRHRLSLRVQRFLAVSRGLCGDPAGAYASLTELAAELSEELGPRHPETLEALAESGRWTGEAGDTRGAVAAYEAATEGFVATLGPLHPETLTTRHNLAYWCGLAGRPDRAVRDLSTVVHDAEHALGSRHPTTITFRANLAYWRGSAGQADQGRAELTALLPLAEEVFGPAHPRVLRIRQHRAELRHRAGEHSGAAAELDAVVAAMREIQGADHVRTREAAGLLARWTAEEPRSGASASA